MSTFFNAPTQAIGGGGLSSREGKRNRKTQALSALLSASALGLFLEGCSTPSDTIADANNLLNDISDLTDRINSSSVTTYDARPGDNLIIDDTEARITFDTNRVGGRFTLSTSYYSYEFDYTREGDNLIVEAPSKDGQGTIRVEIVDYFLNPGNFDLVYNAFGFGGSPLYSDLTVPSRLPDTSASALAASVASLSDEGSVTLLVGSEDNDILQGRDGADTLLGRDGNDILEGRGGADTLNGGEGADTLFGGTGADTYVFGEGDGADTIVEVAEEGVVNTLKFEGDYEVSDFSFARSSEDGTDLVIVADTDGDGQAENEVTLKGYFVSETSIETVYSIELQINDEEAFVPSVEG